MDLQRFKHPPAEYRVHPFWFWNGNMEDKQIELQIVEMADKGVGGFFLCARQGMSIPYLSKAWFDKVRFAVETAKRHGLHVWLYDEYPYPSGMAGGQVILEHPDAKHRHLIHKSVRVGCGERVCLDLPWGRVLMAEAVPVALDSKDPSWTEAVDVQTAIGNLQSEPVFQKTGLTAYNQQRFFTYQPIQQLVWQAPDGANVSWDVHLFLEVEIDDFKYYGTFVDPGHSEAMATFIQLTHQRYQEELGSHFGDTIKGMFTDEIGYLGRYPWSSRLPQLHDDKFPRNLTSVLPALVDSRYPDAARIRYEYFQSLHLLLREAYHKQVHDWCEAHGLEYVAEVPSMRMSTQLFSHVVGSDSAHDKLGESLPWVIDRYSTSFRWNPKMTSSLARQLDLDRALVECFHSIGWSMTLQDARWMIDRMAAMGINFFNFHAFFYTLDGMTKHDAPPSQFLQNPYWAYFRQLGDYVGRLCYLMSQGETVCSIALLDSTTSLWTKLGNPMHGFHYAGYDADEEAFLGELQSDWMDIGKSLLLHHQEYDHLDPELLASAEIGPGRIRIGRASYSVLILPPMTNIEAAAWQKIEAFVKGGGTVIGLGLLPYERIEDASPAPADVLSLFGLSESPEYPQGSAPSEGIIEVAAADSGWHRGPSNTYFIPKRSKEAMLDNLQRLLAAVASSPLRLGDTRAIGSFLAQCRKIDDAYYVFVSNQENQAWDLPVNIALGALPSEWNEVHQRWIVERLDVETGDVNPIPFERRDGELRVSTHFHPFESRLIRCRVAAADARNAAENDVSSSPLHIVPSASGWWEVEPLQLNILRFETFDLTLHPEDESSPSTAVRVKTFIDQCSDLAANQSVPLAFQQQFGIPMQVKIGYPVRCRYTTKFNLTDVPSECGLFMDEGAISGDFVLYLNGHPLRLDEFHPEFVYDHMNRSIDVLDFLRVGENVLCIEGTVSRDFDGVVDAIYLRGDFGVEVHDGLPPVIVQQPTQGHLRGGVQPGYPYYAGTLLFRSQLTLSDLPTNSEFELSFNDWDPHFHDCADVLVNGISLGTRVWTPYRWRGDTGLLKSGFNTLEVKVTNTLVQTLEGRFFDYESHQLRSVVEPSDS